MSSASIFAISLLNRLAADARIVVANPCARMRSPPLLERALSELAYAEISRCSVTRASLTPPDRPSHRRERKREQDKDAGPSVVQVPQTTAENDGPRARNEDLARSKRSKLLRKRGLRMTSRDAKRYKRFPCLPDRSMRTLGRLSVAKSNLSRECCVVGSTCAKSKTWGCRVARTTKARRSPSTTKNAESRICEHDRRGETVRSRFRTGRTSMWQH